MLILLPRELTITLLGGVRHFAVKLSTIDEYILCFSHCSADSVHQQVPNGEDDFSSNDFGHFQSASTDFGHFPTSRDDSVINDCDNHSSCDDGTHDEKCRKSRQEILAEHNGNAGDEVGLSKSSYKM